MNDLRTAAQQALEALEFFRDTAICSADTEAASEAITALRAALAQQAEPVEPLGQLAELQAMLRAEVDRLIAAGIQPQRKPLTQEEIEQEYKKGYADGYAAGYDNGDSEGFTRGTDSMVPASLAAWRAETKPLTEAQIYAAIKGIDSLKAVEVARAIERAHGIKE